MRMPPTSNESRRNHTSCIETLWNRIVQNLSEVPKQIFNRTSLIHWILSIDNPMENNNPAIYQIQKLFRGKHKKRLLSQRFVESCPCSPVIFIKDADSKLPLTFHSHAFGVYRAHTHAGAKSLAGLNLTQNFPHRGLAFQRSSIPRAACV